MTAVMDSELAIVLSKILDSYELGDDNRKRRMDCQKFMQLLMSWKLDSFGSSRFGGVLLSGSSYETTTINGLSSDMDYMYTSKNIRVIENIQHWRPYTGVNTYIMESSGSCKAFVKLYLLSKIYPGPVYSDTIRAVPTGHISDAKKKILLKNNSENFIGFLDTSWEQHGPALTEKRLGVECDNVISIKCDCFPAVSVGWKNRQTSRTRSRISNAIIDQATYCYLVAVGNKGSPTENVEWRLSFSHIENSLVHAWNNIQYKCYVMMKFVKKDLIEPSAPGIICSYHFKTILMWLNEEYDKGFFVESNFDKCLITCIQNLLISTKNRSLPHYFIEGVNLLYGKKNNELKEVSSVLEHLLSTWPQCLFKIKSRKFGVMLHSCISRCIPPHVVCKRKYGELNPGGYFGVKQEREHFVGCYLITRVSLNSNAKQSFKSLFNLKKRTNSVVWENKKECREFIDFLTRDELCRFGLALIRQSGTMQNKEALYHRRAGNGCIRRYINDCFSSTCLEVAGQFTVDRDFQTALTLLEKAEKQLKLLTCVRYPNFNNITIKEHCKYYYRGDIWYTTDTLAHVPRGLAYEFFYKTQVSPSLELEANNDYNLYFHKDNGNVSIPSAMLLYYLQFHCFHGLGRHSERKVALDNMEWISVIYKHDQISSEYKYNIIGHCYRTSGEYRKAYWNYKKSLKVQKYYNAVLWHLAVLLRARIRGQR